MHVFWDGCGGFGVGGWEIHNHMFLCQSKTLSLQVGSLKPVSLDDESTIILYMSKSAFVERMSKSAFVDHLQESMNERQRSCFASLNVSHLSTCFSCNYTHYLAVHNVDPCVLISHNG